MSDSTTQRLSRRQAIAAGFGGAALLAAARVPAQTLQYKTPGVYIVEENAFPNAVVSVATAVPAFVGYTERAGAGGQDQRGKPVRIASMAGFEQVFGGAPNLSFGLIAKPAALSADDLAAAAGADGPALRMPMAVPAAISADAFELARLDRPHILHDAMRLFFDNGGGDCVVVSVGGYDDRIDSAALTAGVSALEQEAEPTLLVIPEAVRLSGADAAALQGAMLRHCGEVMRSRIAILDVRDGYLPRDHAAGDPVAAFRTGIGATGLSYGAAYYPWLETTLRSPRDFTFANLTEYTRGLVAEAVKADHGESSAQYAVARRILPDAGAAGAQGDAPEMTPESIAESLGAASPFYSRLKAGMAAIANRLPPSAAMAGVYTRVDNEIGVWQAPANVGLETVAAPSVSVSGAQQDDLNLPLDGKAVNAIRAFPARGLLVWGARTLDGNSQDWRYISVRRTVVMIEQSIRQAIQAYVFEPNDASTWASVRAMIGSFLNSTWKAGGLAGESPADAYGVDVGLGATMTALDMQDGIMRVTVRVAIVRPAEFIVITFEQKMQDS